MDEIKVSRLQNLLPVSVLIFCLVLGILYLTRGFGFMLSGGKLPVDLALRWWELRGLIDGQNIYQTLSHLPYPPGALFLLYPLIGWMPYDWVEPAWALWNGLALILLLAITYLILKNYLTGWWLFASVSSVLVFQSIGQGLAIGQIALVYMSAFSVFLWILLQEKKMSPSLKYGFMPLLLAFYAGKFTIFLPVCFYLLLHKKYRLMILAGAAWHIIGFAVASLMTGVRLPDLILDWLQVGESFEQLGSIDLSFFLGLIGIGTPWNILLALLGMIILSVWLYRTEVPLLFAVAILMIYGRFWMYHNHYDNVMLWPVLLVLWMLFAKTLVFNEYQKASFITLSLFIISVAIPARFLYWDAPFYGVFLIFQMILWIGLVVYLVNTSRNDDTHFAKASAVNDVPKNRRT